MQQHLQVPWSLGRDDVRHLLLGHAVVCLAVSDVAEDANRRVGERPGL